MTVTALLWENLDGSTEVYVDTLHPSHPRERYDYFAKMRKPPTNMRLVEIEYHETVKRDTMPCAPDPECEAL